MVLGIVRGLFGGNKPQTIGPISDAAFERELAQLKADIAGSVSLTFDPATNENNLFANKEFGEAPLHGTPRFVVKVANKGDVIAAVSFAARAHLPLTPRGTGHSYGGMYLRKGSVQVDLSALKRLVVDPVVKTATFGPGTGGAQFREATIKHGLHGQSAHVLDVGLGGFTLGGGYGWGYQKFGAACDNLVWAEVVLPTPGGAKVVRVDKDSYPDLFWGIKGGGHFLGVVTEFCVKLHEVPDKLPSLTAIYGLDSAPELLTWYRDYALRCPANVQTVATLATAPQGGALVVVLSNMGFAPMSDPQVSAAMAELEALMPGKRYALMKEEELPYMEAMKSIDHIFHKPEGHEWVCGGFVKASDLTPARLARFKELFEGVTSPRSILLFTQPGSKPSEPSAHDAWREGYIFVSIYSMWSGAADTHKHVEYGRKFAKELPIAGMYLNTIMGESEDEITRSFTPGALRRLRGLQRKYDPLGLMRRL